VRISDRELTFNWGYVPLRSQLHEYESSFGDVIATSASGLDRPLLGGKGEGVAFSTRVLRQLRRVPGLKLVIVIREPAEWLESLYNLRAFECWESGECGNDVPSLEDVVLSGKTFKDVGVEFSALSSAVEAAARIFFQPGQLLLLEFELLRTRPRDFFDRLTDFLGVDAFPQNYSFTRHASEDRQRYAEKGLRASLCSEAAGAALAELRNRLAQSDEHARLARLLAESGAPFVSRRLVLGRTHCD